MSGIAAIIRIDGAPVAAADMAAMMQAMDFRVADSAATWVGQGAALGHRSRNANAADAAAAQPYRSEDGGVVCMIDGYLANHDELVRDLEALGARPRTGSDVELACLAWQHWGHDCPRRLNGEFAIIIWDERSRQLFAARDHQGLRPLYFRHDGDRLLLASDACAILALLEHRPELNFGYLCEVLTGRFYTAHETIWQGIERLAAGHTLTFDAGGLRRHRYWSLPLDVSITYKRQADYIEHYRAMLEGCIAHAARTDRPVSCDVSGGLDSTAIFCLADAMAKAGTLPAPDLLGFTLAGPDGDPSDERRYARAAAAKTGRAVTEVPLFLPGLDWFDRFAQRTLDIPPVPNTTMALSMWQAAAAAGCRVSLTGLGGDQWLSGSAFQLPQALRSGNWAAVAATIGADVRDLGIAQSIRRALTAGILPALAPHLSARVSNWWRNLRGRGERWEDLDWLTPQANAALAERHDAYLSTLPLTQPERAKQQRLTDPYHAAMFDFNNRQFATLGIEMRHPMHSRDFIEFSSRTPEHIRRQGNVTKVLHRQAMQGILPEAVLERRDKAEFSIAFFQHDEAIAGLLEAGLTKDFGQFSALGRVTSHFAAYRSAQIDEKFTRDIWGIYLIDLLLRVLKDP